MAVLAVSIQPGSKLAITSIFSEAGRLISAVTKHHGAFALLSSPGFLPQATVNVQGLSLLFAEQLAWLPYIVRILSWSSQFLGCFQLESGQQIAKLEDQELGGVGAECGHTHVHVRIGALFVYEKAQRLCDGRRRAGEGKGQGGRSVYGPGVGKSGEEERSQLEGIVSV